MEMHSLATVEFVCLIRDLGVQVAADGDRLTCSAPKGVLTAELKTELARRKGALLEYLRSPRAAESPRIRRVMDRAELPLSSGQQRGWFLDQIEQGEETGHLHCSLQLSGSLDVRALEVSISEIINRHEILRMGLTTVHGAPKAFPVTGAVWKLRLVDLQGIKDGYRDEQISREAAEDAKLPFDLEAGLLLRASLLKFSDSHHVLLLTVHPLAADDWSMRILVSEFAQLYEAYRDHRPSPLALLPLQYADFAEWQNRLIGTDVIKKQLRYWRQRLQPPIAAVELPADRTRGPKTKFRTALLPVNLSGKLAESIRALSVQEETTLFVTMLSAFKVLLHRYTRQEDVVIGSVVSGRTQPELENLVGPFSNPVALRASLAGDPSVKELIRQVRETCVDAFANQDIPFARLAVELQPETHLKQIPAFPVMFTLQNRGPGSFELPGLSIRPLRIHAGIFRSRLAFDVCDEADGSITLHIAYDTDLFEQNTIERLAGSYRHLLNAMTVDVGQRISELPITGAEELREILSTNEQSRAEYPRKACIHDLFEQQAQKTPERVAVVYGSQSIRFDQLSRRSNQIAHRLRKLGVGPGSLVGICLERSIDMVAALLGVLKAGGAYVPMDPHFPEERLAFMAADAGIRVLVTEEESRGLVAVQDAAIVSLDGDRDKIDQESQGLPPATATADDLAYVIYTSGSTGKPKGVQIGHRSVVNFLQSMLREPGLSADDRLLSVTTLSFDIAGLEIYLPLIVGARIVLASYFVASDAFALARLLADSQANVMQATPATWRLLLESGWHGSKKLKVLCGGEALPRELANRLLATCGEVWNLYGPTETTIWSTLYRLSAGQGPVPIGRPIANTQLFVLDEHRRPVPPGVPGELYIGGDGLARGYLNLPELTAEKFVPHPFAPEERLYRTGDLVRALANGDLVYLCRNDYQVKIRGFRVELGEIESALHQCEGVADAVAVVREDVPGDQRLVAYVIPRAGARLSADSLRSALLRTLPDYFVPSVFVVQTSLPLTPNRKIDRKALPVPGLTDLLTTSSAAPSTEAEESVAAIWKELLHVERVGVRDNFFDLGGHSLLLVQLQTRLRRRFGREISVLDMFQRPTIAAMAEFFASMSLMAVLS